MYKRENTEKDIESQKGGDERKNSSFDPTRHQFHQKLEAKKDRLSPEEREKQKKDLIDSIKSDQGKADVLRSYDRALVTQKKALEQPYSKNPEGRALDDRQLLEKMKKRYNISMKHMSPTKADKYRNLYGAYIPDGEYYKIGLRAGDSLNTCYKNIIVYDKETNTGTFIGLSNFRDRPADRPITSDPRTYDGDVKVEGTKPFHFSDIKDGSCTFLQEELKCNVPINITHYMGKSVVNQDTRDVITCIANARGLGNEEILTLNELDKEYPAIMGTETNLSQRFFIEKYGKPEPSIVIGPRKPWAVDFIVFKYQ